MRSGRKGVLGIPKKSLQLMFSISSLLRFLIMILNRELSQILAKVLKKRVTGPLSPALSYPLLSFLPLFLPTPNPLGFEFKISTIKINLN